MGMHDAQFPSGPWTGFYTYSGPKDKHRMDLHLDFTKGQMTGDGNDDIGAFVIRGKYDTVALECHWTKRYLGKHDVYYEGYREGKGIWGRWEINAYSHGGFHIWPKSAQEGETESTSAQEKQEVELVAPKSMAGRAG